MSDKSNKNVEVDQDIPYQKKEWRVERFGWLLMLFFIGVSLAGFTGSGPVNSREIQDNPLTVTYKPYARNHSPTELEVQINNVDRSPVLIAFDKDFLKNYQIKNITPEPDKVITQGNKQIYLFDAQEVDASFYMEPQTFGQKKGFIQYGDKKAEITQLIFP